METLKPPGSTTVNKLIVAIALATTPKQQLTHTLAQSKSRAKLTAAVTQLLPPSDLRFNTMYLEHYTLHRYIHTAFRRYYKFAHKFAQKGEG